MRARRISSSPLLAAALATLAPLAGMSAGVAAGVEGDSGRNQFEAVRQAAQGSGVLQANTGDPGAAPAEIEAQAVTSSGMFFDAIGDNEVLSPDLQRMLALTSDDGRYTVSISLNTNALVDGDFLSTFVNTDGNPNTGNATFGGADVVVSITGVIGTDLVSTMRWNGAGWEPVSMPSLISFASGSTDEVWSVAASELGVAPGTPTTLYFASTYLGSYFDFAPDFGTPFTFVAGAGALSSPPPTAPAPTSPAPAPAAGGSTAAPRAITAPATYPLAVRGVSFSTTPTTLRTSIRWTKGAGRVTWALTLRAIIKGRPVTKLVRGAGQAGTRTINRTVQIPASWAGHTISARLVVRNDGRSIVRSGSIRF